MVGYNCLAEKYADSLEIKPNDAFYDKLEDHFAQCGVEVRYNRDRTISLSLIPAQKDDLLEEGGLSS